MKKSKILKELKIIHIINQINDACNNIKANDTKEILDQIMNKHIIFLEIKNEFGKNIKTYILHKPGK